MSALDLSFPKGVSEAITEYYDFAESLIGHLATYSDRLNGYLGGSTDLTAMVRKVVATGHSAKIDNSRSTRFDKAGGQQGKIGKESWPAMVAVNAP